MLVVVTCSARLVDGSSFLVYALIPCFFCKINCLLSSMFLNSKLARAGATYLTMHKRNSGALTIYKRSHIRFKEWCTAAKRASSKFSFHLYLPFFSDSEAIGRFLGILLHPCLSLPSHGKPIIFLDCGHF